MKSPFLVIACALVSNLVAPVYAATRTTTLSVSGMTCAACPITVKSALSRVDGVQHVSVNYEAKEATVTFDDARTTVSALTKATADAGYPSTAKEGAAK